MNYVFLFGLIRLNVQRVNLNLFASLKMKRVPNEKPSFLKMGNYGDDIIELKKAKDKGFDDVLFLDSAHNVKECSTSNIFFIKGKNLVTPLVDSCLLDGITRRNLINYWQLIGGAVIERDLKIEEIEQFETILLTNSIQLIRPCFQLETICLNEEKVFGFFIWISFEVFILILEIRVIRIL